MTALKAVRADAAGAGPLTPSARGSAKARPRRVRRGEEDARSQCHCGPRPRAPSPEPSCRRRPEPWGASPEGCAPVPAVPTRVLRAHGHWLKGSRRAELVLQGGSYLYKQMVILRTSPKENGREEVTRAAHQVLSPSTPLLLLRPRVSAPSEPGAALGTRLRGYRSETESALVWLGRAFSRLERVFVRRLKELK